MKKKIATLLAGAVVWTSFSAQAAVCNVSEVAIGTTTATSCSGISNGPVTAENLGFSGFTEVTSAQQNGKGSGVVDGVTFNLSVGNDINGTWALDVSGPITIDLVVVLQATIDTFASYFFNSLALNTTPGSGSGIWQINYFDPATEDFASLGELSIWVASVAPPPPNGAPEPATLALFALATLAAGFTRRRTGGARR